MASKNKAFHFLQGGGDMGKLIRATDWSKTPIGDPDSWPHSLRTMVNVMLDNPFGMYIAWGPEFTQIYNDGYRPILGTTKHPQALGQSSKDTFSEIWHIIGSMFQGVMEGKPVGFSGLWLPLNRHGYVENCYFDFAYSPIRLETGEVGGILVTVIETTDNKKAKDELEESKDQLEFALEAAQLATYDYNPLTNKFSSNNRLKQWFGLPSEDEIELNDAFNVIAEADKQRVSDAILKALDYSSEGIYNVEYTIINKLTQAEIIVHAKGKAWFNEDKIAYRLNGTLEDVTNRVLAREKILESERSFRLMILQAPVAISILRGGDYKIEIANKYALELWGRTEEEVLNKSLFNALPEISSQGIKELLDNVYRTGNPYTTPERPVTFLRNGVFDTVYVNFSYEALYNSEGIINGIMAIAYDVTPQVEARKKIEESEIRYHNLIHSSPSSITILHGKNLIITIANDSIIEYWGKGKEVIGKPYFEVLPEMAEQGYMDIFENVYKTGIPFTAIETPVQIVQHGEITIKYYNFIIYPQRDINGEIDGIAIIATEVTSQALLNNSIKESEQSTRALVESAPFPIGVYVGEELRITLANQSIMDAWGKGYDVIGKLYTEVLPELGNQQIFEKIRKVLHTGIPFHAKNQKVDLVKNGILKSFYFNYSFTPLLDVSGNVFAVMNTAAEVTELHEAKHKVEESEKRFRDSVKQAPLGITIFRGPENIVEMANESYLELVDKTEAEFVGKPLFEILPEVKKFIESIIDEIYRTGEAYYGNEFPVILNRHGKTETNYFNFVYHPLEENNIITGIMAVATEVTATVKAKHIIEENEEKLSLIIESSELGVFDVNMKSGEFVASNRCHEILGFPEERNLTREYIISNLHPEDLHIRKKAFEKAFISGTLHYQSRVIWKDNSVHWMDAKGKVFYNKNNEPKRILGTIRDITEERNFHQQLLEREEKFRLLADSMPQFVWTSDPKGNLNYFNQSVFDFSGLKPEKVYKEGWLQIVHPDDREENIKNWLHAISSGEDFLIEHRFRNSNGEFRWQLSRAIPQKDIHGNIKMWVGTSTDIQEQKMFTTELENMVQLRTNELQQKNIDLEKMNKELQSFVYISSHDLQEPLRKIQTFASRILEKEYASLTQRAQNDFTKINKSAYRMQRLIQDLLAYSRTEVKEINYEIIDLHEIINDVKETLSEELKQNNVTLNLDIECKVKIIPVQFKQIIHNLISNSIKFARKDQPLIIEINCEKVRGNNMPIKTLNRDKNFCHIRFSDNGIGFEQQYSEKIFEVFQRLHSKEEYSGTGIGLAIVKKIIDNHNGNIIATSILNEGAVFDIYIPA